MIIIIVDVGKAHPTEKGEGQLVSSQGDVPIDACFLFFVKENI